MPRIKVLAGAVFALVFAVPALVHAQAHMAWSGTVSSVSGSNISLMANGTSYTVDASNAKIVRRGGAGTRMSLIMSGDTVQVQGTASGTTITATLVRDMSLVGRTSFTAHVRSISGSSFTMQTTNFGHVTVNTVSSTTITKNGQPASFSSIAVGDMAMVNGVWNTAHNVVTASSISI